MTTPQPPGGTRERMRDAVSKVMQQVIEKKEESKAAVQKERRREVMRERMRRPLLILLTVGFIGSLAYGIPRWQHPFPVPTGAAAEHNARGAIALAAGIVDRFVIRNGHPPGTLNEVGLKIPGLIYQRVGSVYVLSMDVEGRRISFQSGEDRNAFKAGP